MDNYVSEVVAFPTQTLCGKKRVGKTARRGIAESWYSSKVKT